MAFRHAFSKAVEAPGFSQVKIRAESKGLQPRAVFKLRPRETRTLFLGKQYRCARTSQDHLPLSPSSASLAPCELAITCTSPEQARSAQTPPMPPRKRATHSSSSKKLWKKLVPDWKMSSAPACTLPM